MSIKYNEAKPIYTELFNSLFFTNLTCAKVDAVINRMLTNKSKYDYVASQVGTGWFIVAILHCMESSLNFSTHLHNGDSLKYKTVNVPKGRIPNINPPYKWEQSAIDALKFRNLQYSKIDTIEEILWFFECWNGLAYWKVNTTPPKRSPYLWASSNHYKKGKFVSDGSFDSEAVSKQIGAAVFLKRMIQKNLVSF